MSHQVREVLLCPAEVDDAGDEYGQGDHCRDGEACIVNRDVSEEDGTVCIEEAGEGVQREEPLQVLADDACRVYDGGDEHEELDEEREDELDVPVLHADRREPVAHPGREEERQ